MEIQKTSGIVLSSQVLGESDILCQILTRNYGKRKFLFKGLKKSRKRPKSAADPGSLLSMIYYFHDDREIHIINEFAVDRDVSGIRDNLDKIYQLYYLLEIVEKSLGFNDANMILFNLLSAGLEALEKSAAGINLPLFFTIHLLRIHGILPDMESCSCCSSRTFLNFSLDIEDLSVVCSDCGDDSAFLDMGSKKFLQASVKKKFAQIDHSLFSQPSLRNLLFELVRFMENYFNINIKTGSTIIADRGIINSGLKIPS